MTANKPGADDSFPGLFNAYIETMFMGYPKLISEWKMETQQTKETATLELYEKVFNEKGEL